MSSGPVDLDAEAKKPVRKRTYRKANPTAYRTAIVDTRVMIERTKSDPEAWKLATHGTLLGLYALLHERAYAVEPHDLSDEWNPALSAVKKFVEREFGGDVLKCVAFVRWVFSRELRSLARNSERSRLQWRWVFSTAKAVDYRASRASR